MTVLVTAQLAFADPEPSPEASNDPCDFGGPAEKYCREGRSGIEDAPGIPDDVQNPLDPLQSLGQGIAKFSAWVVDRLSNAVEKTGDVDFTNSGFLTSYAVVFAASTFLTMLLWLWAVAKRAIRGVPLTTAIGEAIGLLWLTVLASAFTPLILYTVVSAVDGLTTALSGGEATAGFFDQFAKALRSIADDPGDAGPIGSIVLGLVSMAAAGVVLLELAVRAALLYVGGILGTIVYSGLVDKELWSRVRRWVGLMSAIILVKPIIVIVMSLAGALAGGNKPDSNFASVVSGLSIIIISIIASAMLFSLIPGMGDDIVKMRRESYDPASQQSRAAVMRPAQGVRQGISTHATRDAASRPAAASASVGTSSSSSASGGMSAHASRPTGSDNGRMPAPRAPRPDVPRQGDRGTGDSSGRR
ncbi:hypothetical protein [Streptomyces sp. NBC_01304]|uniref:hypothetical protein n=1 Tax=Streptomyces sp. NBC_01304 TaxID=2903818 RepID=UPI002E1686A8|nr:hypothetical protein OG430_49285 [Streptomyces sp. NBC_01304]